MPASATNVTLPASVLHFLLALGENNYREWFQDNKTWFLEEQARVEAWTGALLQALNRIKKERIRGIKRVNFCIYDSLDCEIKKACAYYNR